MLTAAIATCLIAGNLTVRLTVFAAASLREPFTAIARAFEAANSNVRVALSFAGSNTLAAQINNGAPADVFASASTKNLDDCRIDRASRQVFARNRLAIALRKGLKGVASLRDLPKVGRLVLADKAVPAGSYGESFLDSAAAKFGREWLSQVRSRIVSREADVKAVLAKVKLGEADAGIVYASDVLSAKAGVDSLSVPDLLSPPIDYPVAIPASAPHPAEAKAFIKFLMSERSQATLAAHGLMRAERPARQRRG